MKKSLTNRALMICALIPMVVMAQTSVNVPWTGTPGEISALRPKQKGFRLKS